MKPKIKLYSKFCLKCICPEKYGKFKQYVADIGYELEFIRTAYSPELHKEASEIYGDETYQAFFIEKGKVVDFMTWDEKLKKKPIKRGKRKNGEGQNEAKC